MNVIFKFIIIGYILLITIFLASLPCGILEIISTWCGHKVRHIVYIFVFIFSFFTCIGSYMYQYSHPIVKYENKDETLMELDEANMITKWRWNGTLPIFASQYYVYDVYDGKYYTVDVSYLFIPEICTYRYAEDGYAIIYNGLDF